MDKSLYLHGARKPKTRRPEQIVQIGIMSHLIPLMAFKRFMVIAVPNGGYRTPAEAGILKGMGVMQGVTDTILLFRGKVPECSCLDACALVPPLTGWGRAVWVELKLRSFKTYKIGPNKGKTLETTTKLEPEQEVFRDRVTALGFDHRVVYALDINDGLNQFKEIMREYGVS